MLEDVSARLRPRSVWEGLDLGSVLATRHFPMLMRLWSLTVVPLWLVICLLLHAHPFWAVAVIWWLRPMYDRVPLYYLSRVLFGEKPSMRQIFRALPGIVWKGLIPALTYRRFSPWRSFTTPILILENSTGRAYGVRGQSLLRHGSGTAMLLTMGGWIFEFCLTLGLAHALFTFVPGGLFPEATQFVERWNLVDFVNMPSGFIWTVIGLWLAALTVVEQFFVAGGFCLYLNSRSHMEGWDIEIHFRALSERLRSMGLSVVLLGALAALVLAAPQAEARGSAEEEISSLSDGEYGLDPEEAARNVKARGEFTVHRETVEVIDWEKVNASKTSKPAASPSSGSAAPWGSWNFSGGELAGQLFFWGLIGLALCFLGWLVWKNRDAFRRNRSGRIKEEGPRTVMGLNVAPEALPKHLVQSAQEMWRAGDYQGALRLLYCGAISHLIEKAQLPVVESDTEGDCLRHAEQLPDEAQKGYFHHLTNAWMTAAYANTAPPHASMEWLLSSWPFAGTRSA